MDWYFVDSQRSSPDSAGHTRMRSKKSYGFQRISYPHDIREDIVKR